MSHFIGLCFGDYWENDLEQYYEGLEVEPYIKYTKEEAIQLAQKRHAEHYDEIDKMLDKDSLDKDQFDRYNKILSKGPSLSYEQAWEHVKSWGYKLDKDENLVSTYNPDSKWDWYEIGGRWSGFLVLKERNKDGSIQETNEACFDEIDWDYMKEHRYSPFCFIDENGDWHEKGEMGWFGMSFNDMSDDSWDKCYEDFLKEVDPTCYVTVIDFHI